MSGTLKAYNLRDCFYISMTIENSQYEPWTEFRRAGPQSWEVLMGDSWEQAYHDEELEAAYQEATRILQN